MRPLLLVSLLCAAALAACGSSSGDPAAASTTPTGTAAPTRTAAAAQAACPVSGGSTTKVPGAPLATILRVPSGLEGKPAPLVVALHFASGTGAAMERNSRWTKAARKAGFAVAYPSAPASNHFWNARDLAQLTATLDAIAKAACIDAQRVYVTGWSNGGGMAALTACALADRVAAVSLWAPARNFTPTCAAQRNVPVLELHGTADTIVRYTLGRAYLGRWAGFEGCSTTPRTSRVRTRISRLTFPGCDAGGAVQQLRLQRGRHIQLVDDFRAAGLDPATAAWQFLKRYSLG